MSRINFMNTWIRNGRLRIGYRKLLLLLWRRSCGTDARLLFQSDDGKSYMLATSRAEAQALSNVVLAHIAGTSYFIDPETQVSGEIPDQVLVSVSE